MTFVLYATGTGTTLPTPDLLTSPVVAVDLTASTTNVFWEDGTAGTTRPSPGTWKASVTGHAPTQNGPTWGQETGLVRAAGIALYTNLRGKGCTKVSLNDDVHLVCKSDPDHGVAFG